MINNIKRQELFPYLVLLLGSNVLCQGIDISSKQLAYLQDYGYLPPPDPYSGALKTQESLKDALEKFQRYADIPITGKLDDKTIQKFSQSRCGVKDISNTGRSKRYAVKGLRWKTKDLTYQIVNWTNDLPRIDVAKSVKKAFAKWQAVSNLRLRYKRHGTADIMIKFARKDHNDQYAFDGPGGTIAHAFFPGNHPLAGDTHFDDDETFTLRSTKGKNFYWVALHEFGHALGLDHTNVRGTVMFPWYDGYKGHDMDLSQDDIKGIQYLYGAPKDYRYKKPMTVVKPKENPSQCLERVQTITSSPKFGETVVINHNKLYIYDDRNLKRRKGPIALSKYLAGGLESADAAYTLPNGNTIYIQGFSTWEYKGRKVIRKDVSLLRRGYSNEIFDVDAAFYWSKAKKVYIFKGAKYWRYNPWARKVDKGYPKLIRDSWKGVPDDIDSVFEWNKKVFFFKGNQYYRFDEDRFEVVKSYPKFIANTFFVCENVPRVSRLTALDPINDGQSTSASQRLSISWALLLLPYMVIQGL